MNTRVATFRIFLSTLVLLFVGGCGQELDLIEPCDDCQGQCTPEPGFEFDSYNRSCGDGPNLCLSAYTDVDGDEDGGDEDDQACRHPDFSLVETTVADIHDALLAGEISCEWVLSRYLERTLQYDLLIADGQAPYNAFIALNDGALDTARRLDDYQRCEGELAGPLHCVPFAIKGNYASTELPTTAGSLGIGDAQASDDAFVVERLRSAGAVMVGTTAMDEFAKGLGGYSSRSGKSGNAYDSRRRSGGSSGGSAVATSANMTLTALGTDNCSSLTLPAAYNGLVTIRPTHGLLSTEGSFPLNRLNQTVGPMARTVEDLARMMDVMAQRNPDDAAHCQATPPRPDSYLDHLVDDGLDGKQIGVVRTLTDEASGRRRHPFDGASEDMHDFYDEFFAELEDLGATIVDPVDLLGVEDQLYSTRNGYDIDQFLARTSGAAVTNVEAFCRSERYNYSLYEDADDCLDSLPQTAEDVARRLENGRQAYGDNRAYVQDVMDRLELDALVYPADPRGGARVSGISSNCVLSSYTGLPSLVVHGGHNALNMPVGMMFTARRYDEATLFEIASTYEAATGYRRPPVMPPVDDPVDIGIDDFNALHLAIGEATFAEILAHQDRWDLDHDHFADIATAVIEDAGFEDLVD